jgi:hypothetical protein
VYSLGNTHPPPSQNLFPGRRIAAGEPPAWVRELTGAPHSLSRLDDDEGMRCTRELVESRMARRCAEQERLPFGAVVTALRERIEEDAGPALTPDEAAHENAVLSPTTFLSR